MNRLKSLTVLFALGFCYYLNGMFYRAYYNWVMPTDFVMDSQTLDQVQQFCLQSIIVALMTFYCFSPKAAAELRQAINNRTSYTSSLQTCYLMVVGLFLMPSLFWFLFTNGFEMAYVSCALLCSYFVIAEY